MQYMDRSTRRIGHHYHENNKTATTGPPDPTLGCRLQYQGIGPPCPQPRARGAIPTGCYQKMITSHLSEDRRPRRRCRCLIRVDRRGGNMEFTTFPSYGLLRPTSLHRRPMRSANTTVCPSRFDGARCVRSYGRHMHCRYRLGDAHTAS